MTNYRVVEMFYSINGEGPRSGQLALFVRMQGCNLSCGYCDTKWANETNCPFHWTSTEEILDMVRLMQVKNVTLTGGEPLNQEGILELLTELSREPGLRVEVETNGSVPLRPFMGLSNPPSFTMDYKLPGSGMEKAMCTDNFALLGEKDTVKFVAGDWEDLCRAEEIIREYALTDRCRVSISPVYGEIELEDIVNFMKNKRLNDVTLQLQLHKIIWDSEMRGV